ncbi:hypothetical protein HYPSUDRAFT_68674 [Hypholoma sublateritium FD-334 SS-4]|uniref:PhoD-like phosphatase domain-containing protein n=1 Tax=Hypholoma sublateritium (strain FD-334 SS-4) TaxID=945553 RepID=A0A0D2L0U6_HYPSF|nr:hypothetical protein HYPSUDRAFT_68674 [Hypholoma sublateritium FD-334 SS-4]
MDETFIGGFKHTPRAPSPLPPALPPKDYPYAPARLPPAPPTSGQLAHMSPVERSQALRVPRMEPHLQFMCGPLLRYDTVDAHGIWHGAALIVTADSGSVYDPHPSIAYTWDPARPVPPHTPPHARVRTASAAPTSTTTTSSSHGQTSTSSSGPPTASSHERSRPSFAFELGPHPADPHSVVIPGSPAGGFGSAGGFGAAANGSAMAMPEPASPGTGSSPSACRQEVKGQELWVYAGAGGTFTFWRFALAVPLASHEMVVRYAVNGGQPLEFWVPGRGENMRWAAHSCNGFSSGVNPDDFRGPGFASGYDPVWIDLLTKHHAAPFHVLVGGGDQIYCDSLMREPELQEWAAQTKPEVKRAMPLTEELEAAIDRFFFSHYCQSFRRGAFARANCSIPMLNMCDDHGASIDGFGSYPDDLQRSPVFRHIGARGYFFFLLFQCFIQVEVDGVQDAPGQHAFRSLIIGEPGPYVRFPSHSFLSRLGPRVYILMLDCRAERKKEQVCSPGEYARVFGALNALPAGVAHLVVQLGIPIAYPRLVFLESALESKFNPLVALGRAGALGLSGFVNKFNAEAELLDDLNDHWTARGHKKERNWLIEQLQNFAKAKRIRVTFLSGDVHCAAIGLLKTLRVKGTPELPPAEDFRYMANVVTSAIVNTPPPNGVLTLVSSLATKTHKTLHHINTDETMVPIFTKEPTGQARKHKHIMGRRNWCQVDFDAPAGALVFDIRVEREKGGGETMGYAIRIPPPAW